jgi:mono/diheme cytochrome c family protein
MRELSFLAVLVMMLSATLGCRQDMHDQPRFEPLEASDFFEDGRSARPIVAGTVPRGFLMDDPHLYTGKVGDEWAESFPMPVTREVMERGRERYQIFCTPCHGQLGDGLGMVVRRGLSQPPSFHEERLRKERAGYYFDVISRGFGRMKDYAAQLEPRDRWAVVAYVRALQLSQGHPADELDARERGLLAPGGGAR